MKGVVLTGPSAASSEAVKSKRRLAVAQGQTHAHGDRPVADAVVVEEVLALEDPLRHGADRFAHLLLRAVQQFCHRRRDHAGAMLGDEFAEAAFGREGGRHLSVDVALALRRAAHVGEDEVELLAIGAVGGEQARSG